MFKKFLPQIIAFLFLAGFVAYAWTEPSSAPPAGNVDSPVNIGSASQLKSGALGVDGVFQAFSSAFFGGKVGIGTTNPQGQLDVGGGKLVVTTEGATNFTVGPNNPATTFNQGGTFFGLTDWWNSGNAVASDDNYASYTGGAGAGCDGDQSFSCSNFLEATGFNFSLPSGAIIDGIQAEIERYGFSAASFSLPQDHSVKIVKAGIIQGSDRSAGYWPTTDAYQSYGGSSDKWGLSWIGEDINSPNFGVSISVKLNGDVDTGWGAAYIDNVRVKVYYHTGGMDVVKTGSVTIASDGSVSANLNADKLDGLNASDMGGTGLYGWCSLRDCTVSPCPYGASALAPAYVTGASCQPTVDCACPAGYSKVQTGVFSRPSSGGCQFNYYSCYKN